jgi:preprotein translocase SecE subunit
MARTRQKRKAKRREQQLKATPRTAAARQQPTNPAEEAVIQAAESLEAADELEQIEMGVAPEEAQATAPEALEGVSAEAAETKPPRKERRPEARQERPRERKPAPERHKEKEPRKRGRVANFLVQVWAELRRVQWPDRNQVTQATGVVVVFCLIAGAYLALWDFVFSKLVTSIL